MYSTFLPAIAFGHSAMVYLYIDLARQRGK